jgi:nitrogen fixation protein
MQCVLAQLYDGVFGTPEGQGEVKAFNAKVLEAEDRTRERDGAYRERAQLLAWLAALHPSSAVIAPALDVDGEEGWQLLYLVAGGWQMSWHIAPADAPLFKHVEHVDFDDPRAAWDGHGTEQKYQRIRQHVRLLALEAAPSAPLTTEPEARSA